MLQASFTQRGKPVGPSAGNGSTNTPVKDADIERTKVGLTEPVRDVAGVRRVTAERSGGTTAKSDVRTPRYVG